MRRWAFCLLAATLGAAVTAPARGSSLEVVAVGDRVVEAMPGEVVTLAFRIVGGEAGLELEPQVDVPAGWEVLSGSGGFRLGRQGADVQIVVVAVPPTAAAGEYEIVYSTELRGGGGTVVSSPRRVAVSPVDRIALTVLDQPGRVLAGEPFEARMLVSNESNRGHEIELRWSQSRDLPLTVTPARVHLAPGESVPVRVAAEVPGEIYAELHHRASFLARVADEPSIVATASIGTTVFPTRTTDTSRWHRLDGEVTLRALTSSADGGQPGGTLRLAGDLDDDGSRRLVLFVQAPEIDGGGGAVSTLREEMFVDLVTPGMHLLVGDFDPPPSRMVSRFRGRGARVAFGREGWRVGASAARTPRRSGLRAEEGGVFVELERQRGAARLDYFERRSQEGGGRARFVDLTTRMRPRRDLDLRLSLAWGEQRGSETDEPTAGWGGQIELLGQRPRWSWDMIYLFGEDGFPGQYAGRSSLYGGLNARLTSRLSLQSSIRSGRAAEEPDLVYSAPPTEQEITSGVYYRVTSDATLSLEQREHRREEINEIAAVNLRERTLRMSYRQRIGKGSVTLRAESGEGDDAIAGESFSLDRYTLEGGLEPHEDLQLYASVEQTRETPLEGGRDGYAAALLRGRWSIDDKHTLEAFYRRRERQFRTASDLDYARLRVARRLPREHQVSLELVRSIQEAGGSRLRDDAVMVGYTVPLSLPVTRRRHVGSVTGRVRDEASGRPLPGVIVRVGQAVARTDREGSFRIAAMDAGSHALVVDATPVDYRLLASAVNPAEVFVRRGVGEEIDLFLTPAAGLRGRVLREASEEERWNGSRRGEEREVPVRDLVVEAGNGRETVRRVTGADGSFSFERLTPGEWTVRAVGPVPEGFRVSPDGVQVELRPAERRDVEIHLASIRRRLRGVPGGGATSIQMIGLAGSD